LDFFLLPFLLRDRLLLRDFDFDLLSVLLECFGWFLSRLLIFSIRDTDLLRERDRWRSYLAAPPEDDEVFDLGDRLSLRFTCPAGFFMGLTSSGERLLDRDFAEDDMEYVVDLTTCKHIGEEEQKILLFSRGFSIF